MWHIPSKGKGLTKSVSVVINLGLYFIRLFFNFIFLVIRFYCVFVVFFFFNGRVCNKLEEGRNKSFTLEHFRSASLDNLCYLVWEMKGLGDTYYSDLEKQITMDYSGLNRIYGTDRTSSCNKP